MGAERFIITVGKAMGQPPNLRELISSADGVTFWAKHDKAIAELGYVPSRLARGLSARRTGTIALIVPRPTRRRATCHRLV